MIAAGLADKRMRVEIEVTAKRRAAAWIRAPARPDNRRNSMKLLRYGPNGAEKPGILDADGKLRDLSGVVRDFDAAALSPAGLKKIAALDPKSLPAVSGTPRIGPPSAHGRSILSALASITPIMPPRAG